MEQVTAQGCFWNVENCTCTFGGNLSRMSRLFCLCLLFLAGSVHAQYYYNDIVSTQASNEQFKLLRNLKIKSITASSFEPDDSPTEGFSLEQEISPDGKKAVIKSSTGAGTSLTTNSYELNKIKKIVTNNKGIESRTDYYYDAAGRVVKIQFTTTDTAMKSVLTEAHEWLYDAQGKAVSMLKTKNRTDSTQVYFVRDESGNIAEEQWQKNGRTVETYYYYYNPKNELTDIVRFNPRLKKLIPDYVYEYDTNGRIARMTQYSLGSSNYFTWVYLYNDKGLKEQERCVDKTKRLVGRISYSYQ